MYSQQTHKIYNLKEPDVNAGVFPTTLEHCSYKCELCPRSVLINSVILVKLLSLAKLFQSYFF